MTKNLPQLDINLTIGLILLIPVCWLACADPDGKDDPCEDTLPPEIRLPADLAGEVVLKAELSVDERIFEDENGAETVIGMFQATFADLSNYEDELIDAIPFGAACVGEVGLHVILSRPVPVGAGTTVFQGTAIGDVALEEDGTGGFDIEIVRERIFTWQGGEELQVWVSPLDLEPSFPGFQMHGIVPPEVTLNGIYRRSDGSIEVDWEGAGTTYFEIVMTAAVEDSGLPPNRLRCLVQDDGCQIIPADGATWLLSTGAEDVTVRLKRHVLAHDAIFTGDLAQIDITRTLEFKLVIK